MRRLREPSKLLQGDWNLLVRSSGTLVWVCAPRNGIVRELEHSINLEYKVPPKAKCDDIGFLAQCAPD